MVDMKRSISVLAAVIVGRVIFGPSVAHSDTYMSGINNQSSTEYSVYIGYSERSSPSSNGSPLYPQDIYWLRSHHRTYFSVPKNTEKGLGHAYKASDAFWVALVPSDQTAQAYILQMYVPEVYHDKYIQPPGCDTRTDRWGPYLMKGAAGRYDDWEADATWSYRCLWGAWLAIGYYKITIPASGEPYPEPGCGTCNVWIESTKTGEPEVTKLHHNRMAVQSPSVSPASSLDAAMYWTPERMATAQPDDAPKIDAGAAHSAPIVTTAWQLQGPTFTKRSDYPAGYPPYSDPLPPVSDRRLWDAQAREGYLPGTFTNRTLPFERHVIFGEYESKPRHIATFPMTAVGRLFFERGGQRRSATAFVVGDRLIFTAGHVIYRNGEWSSNFRFCAGYNQDNVTDPGAGVRSCHSAEAAYVLKGVKDPRPSEAPWTKSSQPYLNFDMGAILLQRDELGRTVGQVNGKLGLQANVTSRQHWESFGYPTEKPFDGRFQVTCQASIAFEQYIPDSTCKIEDVLNCPPMVVKGCDMPGGASGAPWLTSASRQAGDSNHANGIQSTAFALGAKQIGTLSPYFGPGVATLVGLDRP